MTSTPPRVAAAAGHLSAADLADTIAAACARIAPAWPLDRLIAVNPLWGWIERPVQDAAAEVGALHGARLVMPRAWFRDQLAQGRLRLDDIRHALGIVETTLTMTEMLDALRGESFEPLRHPLVTDLRDESEPHPHEMGWRELAMQSVGRACEVFFDRGQAVWQSDRTSGLYATWRAMARTDAAPRVQRGLQGFAVMVDALPQDPHAVISLALDAMRVAPAHRERYLTAVLLSVHGWASACAFRRWEARLGGSDDDIIVELLAARLAWELLLFRAAAGTDLAARWQGALQHWHAEMPHLTAAQEADWILQRALELRYQETLARSLGAAPTDIARHGARFSPEPPEVHAVFCIDVRSEVLRRHLETADPGIHTSGFAGFFGLPIAYAAVDGTTRAQLPGLLAPGLIVEDREEVVGDTRNRRDQTRANGALQRWLSRGVPGMFSNVEATGITAAVSLLRAQLLRAPDAGDPLRDGLDASAVAPPQLVRRADGSALDVDARADLAAGILRAMGRIREFARVVALVGHGAAVTNNPQAAGLACGACGGQSGEVNARALAALLNDAEVRNALVTRGITIPATTRFVGALHDTVTDTVTLFEDGANATHAAVLDRFRQTLALAGDGARRERDARHRPETIGAPDPLARAARRGADWSEVRPEWALAGNAAFIAAPRSRSRHLDLGGRAFLHDYDWRDDASSGILETILTAPVVVAHWINFQYLNSTVDPERYGSGDKTLHNVVGGNVGVYEGAGGDLRIGLARQSVHDGVREVHEPLRLAVYVEAPAAALDAIIARQPVVRQLIEHEWISLYRIATEGREVFARRGGQWVRVAD